MKTAAKHKTPKKPKTREPSCMEKMHVHDIVMKALDDAGMLEGWKKLCDFGESEDK